MTTTFPDEALTDDKFLMGRLRLLQPAKGYRAATDPVLLAAACPAQAGQAVLVNGSRGYLNEARHRYPNLQAICLEAPTRQLRERLLKRGRETARQVEERLLRHQQLQAALRDAGAYCVVEAGGSLEKSVEALLACLDEPGQPTCS